MQQLLVETCGIQYFEVFVEDLQLQSQIVFGLTTFVIKDGISFTYLVVY